MENFASTTESFAICKGSNLRNNQIGDEGVKCISEALRIQPEIF